MRRFVGGGLGRLKPWMARARFVRGQDAITIARSADRIRCLLAAQRA